MHNKTKVLVLAGLMAAGFSISSMGIAKTSDGNKGPTLENCKSTGNGNIQCTYKSATNKQNPKPSFLYAQTKMPYALCNKALCDVNPDKKTATCACRVFEDAGKKDQVSVGPKPYKISQPVYNKMGKMIKATSNFSMANLGKPGDKPITCVSDKEIPWANCFGIQCDVHHLGEDTMATCVCPIDYSKQMITVGAKTQKECTDTGKAKIWSAALTVQGDNNGPIMEHMYAKYAK